MARGGLLRFEGFSVDCDAAEIRRGGEVVPVEPQVFDLIELLCTNSGRVVTHDEILARVWRGRIVSDSTVATRVNAARKALGDDGATQHVIKTVRGRGFRFELSPERAPGNDNTADATADKFVLSCTPHGYSLLMSSRTGEARDDWRDALPRLVADAADAHRGAQAGPGLVAFERATDALSCAAALIESIEKRGGQLPEAERWTVKIGISHGRSRDDTVSARAGRLDAAARPSGICITDGVRRAASDFPGLDIEPLSGQQWPDAQPAFSVHRIGDLTLTSARRDRPAQLDHLGIPEPAEVSVIVLPFEVVGDDTVLEPVAVGLRIEIQNALVQLSGVLPMAAGTASAFRGAASPEAAAVLGLRYVLQGNLRSAGRRLRLMLELYDHRRGGVTWSRSYDGSLDDGFEFQDEITARVITALDVKMLSGEQARVWHSSLGSFGAIQLQYKGMHEFFKMSRECRRTARESFERVHEMCPEASIGATWIALCHWFELQRGWADDREKTIEALERWANIAVSMDDADGQAHTALCHTHLMQRDYDKALEIGERAVTIRPSCANANGFYGHALYYCGNLDEAVHHTKLAIRASPAYPALFAVVLAGVLHARGDHEGAIAVAKETLRLSPSDVHGRLLLCSALVEGSRETQARGVARELRELDAGFEACKFLERLPFRHSGMRDQIARNLDTIGFCGRSRRQ